MINIVISDSVGDRPTVEPQRPAAFFGTPVAPDRTSLQDARQVLRRYDLTDTVPGSIVKYLDADEDAHETPKAFGDRILHFVIGGVADSAERARESALRQGITPLVLTTFLEGESREAGTFLSSVAREIALNRRPVAPPASSLPAARRPRRSRERRGPADHPRNWPFASPSTWRSSGGCAAWPWTRTARMGPPASPGGSWTR